jgi:hypothetical protein
MRKLVVILALVFVSCSMVGVSFAEERDIDTKWQLYNAESKNPWLAVGAAWLMPTLGHAYAGDWGRGLPFFGAEVLGLALMMSSVDTDSVNSGTASAGVAILMVARIWEYIDAYGTAEDSNRKLKEKYGLSLQLRNNSPVLAFNYNL